MKYLSLLLVLLVAQCSAVYASDELPSVSDLRKKSTVELRKFAEEALQEIQGMNLRMMSAEEQLSTTQVELASTRLRFDRMYAWGISENARANDASAQYWEESQKRKAVEKKLFLWRTAGAGLVFVVVFLLVIQITQYMMPPYSILIPIGAAAAASAGVWIFL
jgi:hypothetical protein